jgi:hypothetical protein
MGTCSAICILSVENRFIRLYPKETDRVKRRRNGSGRAPSTSETKRDARTRREKTSLIPAGARDY